MHHHKLIFDYLISFPNSTIIVVFSALLLSNDVVGDRCDQSRADRRVEIGEPKTKREEKKILLVNVGVR
jgi:hypothetical protein